MEPIEEVEKVMNNIGIGAFSDIELPVEVYNKIYSKIASLLKEISELKDALKKSNIKQVGYRCLGRNCAQKKTECYGISKGYKCYPHYVIENIEEGG